MTSSQTAATSKPTHTALENLRSVYKGLLILALLFSVGYVGSFGLATEDRQSGILVLIVVAIVFAANLLTCLVVFCVSAYTYRLRGWAVLIAIPVLVVGLPISIAMLFSQLIWQNPVQSAQEREQRKELVQTHVVQQLPAPTPLPPIDYAEKGIVIPNFYRSAQNLRPITGLSFKPTADFGDTFAGHRQFVMTATNQYSGQAIAIEAIYTDNCATKWNAYPGSDAPDHLAHLGAGLLTGELLFGEYQCGGLHLSAPLHIGNTYIGIEPNKTGSPIELAELPQLVNVITNARPVLPVATP